MNNYHLFLIRSDQVTQIIGHLLAGVVTLALIYSMGAPDPVVAPDVAPASLASAPAALPAGTEMIVAHK